MCLISFFCFLPFFTTMCPYSLQCVFVQFFGALRLANRIPFSIFYLLLVCTFFVLSISLIIRFLSQVKVLPRLGLLTAFRIICISRASTVWWMADSQSRLRCSSSPQACISQAKWTLWYKLTCRKFTWPSSNQGFIQITMHTVDQILQLAHPLSERIYTKSIVMQTHKGNSDCGLFAIAVATALCYTVEPENLAWN